MNHDLITLGKELTRTSAWSLSASEKSQIKSAVVVAMHTTPQAIPSPYIAYFLRRNALVALVLVIAVLGSGTTVAFADDALPGDALYAVKTQVREPLIRAFALSDEAKVAVEIRQAEERLKEVALLAADKRPRVAEAAENAAEKVEQTKARLSAFQVEDADARFSVALLAQADILMAQAQGEETSDTQSLKNLAETAREGGEGYTVRSERAYALIAKARERISERELQQDTREALLAELAQIEKSLAQGSALFAERRAYRVLALAEAAERIRDTAKKEVLVRFHERREQRELAKTAEDPATATLMMATSAETPSSDEDENIEERDKDDEGPELEFRVIDALSEESDEREDDSHERDRSGHGGGE